MRIFLHVRDVMMSSTRGASRERLSTGESSKSSTVAGSVRDGSLGQVYAAVPAPASRPFTTSMDAPSTC